MATQGLLFIPDISGFSRFVNHTEIDHSRLIIQELLETLIRANRIGLEVSEVEGDAILFYKFGDAPALDELYEQVERMFVDFHRSLRAYDLRKYCQCTACLAAKDLTLKVITHYGEFTGYNVAAFNKLIGRDVIVAHELLKNDIENHEYWLITHSLLPDGRPDVPAEWMTWEAGAKQTQSGEVPFQYAQLTRLKDTVSADPVQELNLDRGTRMLAASREYDIDIITLFHATGAFDYRSRWQAGVVRVEELNHLLPRIGMRCRYVMEDGSTPTFASTYYSYGDERIEFVETEEATGNATRYVLEQLAPRRTRLSVEYYFMQGKGAELLFRLTRKGAMERRLEASLEKLGTVVGEIEAEEAAALAERLAAAPVPS